MLTKSVKITEKTTSIREDDGATSAGSEFSPLRRELDEFLFHEGTARHAYTYLGAHAEADEDGRECIVFRVWAPRARAVWVVGSFADWKQGIPMTRVTQNGIFMLSLPGDQVPDGSVYKYRIQTRDGRILLHADPYGRAMELPPLTATRFIRQNPYTWHDGGWLKQRAKHAASGQKYPCQRSHRILMHTLASVSLMHT